MSNSTPTNQTDEAVSDTERTEIHCTKCGRRIGTANSPNSDLHETGEVAHEARLNASVNAPMVSMILLLDFVCEKCSVHAETDRGVQDR